MSNFCIVCEFNPLHNGHAYLIEKARALGAHAVTCIMSGNSTQRGELALTDKYKRSEVAVKCGADLVLELPYPWCSSSAEFFASGAVSVADAFGDVLLFGSECGDVELLRRAALVCDSSDFKAEYEQRVGDGEGSATVYLDCLEKRGYSGLSSNDLLGIAYIRAINNLGSTLMPMTVTRLGAEYNETEMIDVDFQSATALRALIKKCDLDGIRKYVPAAMCQILAEQAEAGNITDENTLDNAILSFFRLNAPYVFADIAEIGGGLENRICAASHSSTSSAEMFESLRTKRFTDAKLRRAILFCMTGVKKEHIRSLPEYTTLLAADTKGRELLAQNRRRNRICVVTKPADAPKQTDQFILTSRLDALYCLAREKRSPSDEFFKRNAYIEKN